MATEIDLLLYNASQVVTCASFGGPKRGKAMRDVGAIPDGAVAVDGGRILEAGPSPDLRERYAARLELDLQGRAVSPGFVDPHTHLVYAGNRVAEFELRIGGATYLEILEAGGGILSTMQATREASIDQLVAKAEARLDEMLALGTTTVEVKTGYGLDPAGELKMLQAIERLAAVHPVTLIPTFLGAHAVPPEYTADREGYVRQVIETMIPAAAAWHRASSFAADGIPLFCDAFCEAGAFSLSETRRILEAGQQHRLPLKLHADEFQSLGGVELAVALGATSVDHLDATLPQDRARLAASETIAVVLPAVNFNFGSAHFADARALIDAGAALAISTDLNPGSAPCPSMPLVMAIATRYQRLLPSEALNAATINAAYAVGLGDRLGSIEPGKLADLLILSSEDYRSLAYGFGFHYVDRVIKRGVLVNRPWPVRKPGLLL